MTDVWKARLLAAMKERGINKPKLAIMLGVSKSEVYKLFKQDSSALVPRLCELFDLRMPMVPNPDEASDLDGKLIDLVRSAPESLKMAWLAVLQASLK